MKRTVSETNFHARVVEANSGQVPVLLAMLIHGAYVEMLGDLSDRPLLDKTEGEIAALNDVILQQCNSCVDSSIGFTLHGHIRAEGGDGGGVGVGNVSGNFSIRSVKCSPWKRAQSN